jgi:hypothetical protein
LTEESRSSDAILAFARRGILLILVLAMAGTFIDLLLTEHFEDLWQLIPLALLVLGFGGIGWHVAAGSRRSRQALRGVMILFVGSGFLGVFLHYRGNAAFEREQNPRAGGWAVFRDAMMGGVPTLAPGVMMQIGLLGLLYAFLPSRTNTRRRQMSDVRYQESENGNDASDLTPDV